MKVEKAKRIKRQENPTKEEKIMEKTKSVINRGNYVQIYMKSRDISGTFSRKGHFSNFDHQRAFFIIVNSKVVLND